MPLTRLIELYILMMLSFIYLTWMHSSLSQRLDPLLSIPPISLNSHGPRSPRLTDPRDGRRSNPISLDSNRNEFGYIWMTVPKNYRYPPWAPPPVLDVD